MEQIPPRIATNNTISHFIVKFRSQGYAQGSGITINGVAFDTSKVDVELNIDGKVIYIDIPKNRNAFTQTYSEPPNVLVDVGSANVTATAKIEAVLFRDTVTTYTPEDVKSFGCAFGSGGSNTFTADIESAKTPFAKLTPVTDFTFTGTAGFKFLSCNGFNGDTTTFLKAGDYVQFTGDDGFTEKAMVLYATKPEGTLKSQNLLRYRITF